MPTYPVLQISKPLPENLALSAKTYKLLFLELILGQLLTSEPKS
jgi:hypothetical protein